MAIFKEYGNTFIRNNVFLKEYRALALGWETLRHHSVLLVSENKLNRRSGPGR